MAKYDAVKRQWESLEPPKFNNDPKLTLGQRILDLLLKHGPKVAQVSKHISAVCIHFEESISRKNSYRRSMTTLGYKSHTKRYASKRFELLKICRKWDSNHVKSSVLCQTIVMNCCRFSWPQPAQHAQLFHFMNHFQPKKFSTFCDKPNQPFCFVIWTLIKRASSKF